MNYCSLDDAFPAMGGAPTPGCEDPYATKQARKEERRKAKRCKGPPLAFFDPDRPAHGTVERGASSGPTLWEPAPVQEGYHAEEDFRKKHRATEDQDHPNFDKDPLYSYVQREVNDHVMHVTGSTTEAYDAPASKKSFFGADPEEDTPVEPIREPMTTREEPASFETAFQPTTLNSTSNIMAPQPSTSMMPFPNMYWKSKTPAQSAFVEHLPPMPIASNRVHGRSRDPEMTEMMRKMDRLFAQLEEVKNGGASPEQMTSEIMMFISSGIVILFLMDLMVKKGGSMRF